MQKISETIPTIPEERRLISRPSTTSGAVLSELTAMLGTMPMRAGSTLDMVATMRIYEQDLSDIPSDLVCDTIRQFRQGKRGNGHFAPTAAEIGAAARETIAARESVQRAREEQEALDRETIAARGARERAAAGRDEDWRERVAREVEALKADLARVSGRRAGGALDWVKNVKPRPVNSFSSKLTAQLRGELPIGQSGEARGFVK